MVSSQFVNSHLVNYHFGDNENNNYNSLYYKLSMNLELNVMSQNSECC